MKVTSSTAPVTDRQTDRQMVQQCHLCQHYVCVGGAGTQEEGVYVGEVERFSFSSLCTPRVRHACVVC